MSEPTSKQIAEEGLRMIAELQEQQKLWQDGLPSPQNATPIKLYGVTFYPHAGRRLLAALSRFPF